MTAPPPVLTQGTVKWFNEKKGFGFLLEPSVDGDVFVHYSSITGEGFKTLLEGELVSFELYFDEKGAKARNVSRLG